MSAADALQKHRFAARALPGGTAGFGGPVTGWHHDPGVFGALEQTPHNDVHGLVGGPSGFMGAFDTAPLDPVFWLHHANIDRLWAVWLAQPNRSNPADASCFPSGLSAGMRAPAIGSIGMAKLGRLFPIRSERRSEDSPDYLMGKSGRAMQMLSSIGMAHNGLKWET